MNDPYSVLGVSKEAPDAVVEAAYQALKEERHPNDGGDPSEFEHIKKAYNQIKSDTDITQSESKSNPSWFEGVFKQNTHLENVSFFDDPEGRHIVEGNIFTVRLLAIVPHTNVWRVVRFPEEMDGEHRTLVLFEIQNTTDDIHRWSSDYTRFVDEEGFSYDEQKSTFIDDDKLQTRWKTVGAELDGYSKTYFVSMIEKMPTGAQISKIIHKQNIFDEGDVSGLVKDKERYVFDIEQLNASNSTPDTASTNNEEEILKDMLRVAEEVGEDITQDEMDDYGRYTSTMVARYFGSWTKAKKRFLEWNSEQKEEDESFEEFDNLVNDRLDDILE